MKKIYAAVKSLREDTGAIVVEATISLSAFIFMMFTLLSIVNIAYAQARIAIATDAAARQMSYYANLYYTANINEIFDQHNGQSSEVFQGVGEILSYIAPTAGTIDNELAQFITETGEAVSGTSLTAELKHQIGMAMAKQLLKKNLVQSNLDTPDAFLNRLRVKGGLDGLNLLHVNFLENNDDIIDVIVVYQIKVVQLLNLDIDFTFMHRATTKAWGAGA